MKLLGAIAVDKPVKISNITPQWGPLSGGTEIEILGEGFEPGNTVMDGLKLNIGSAPVTNIDVISSTRLIARTPRGNVGRQKVYVENRFGQKDELDKENGFGYGMRQLSKISTSLVKPTDVWVDQETGVAVTTAGFFTEYFSTDAPNNQSVLGHNIPNGYRAASFDVQKENQLLHVGAVPITPSGGEGLLNRGRWL